MYAGSVQRHCLYLHTSCDRSVPICFSLRNAALSLCSFLCLGSVGGCSKFLNDLEATSWRLPRARDVLGEGCPCWSKPCNGAINCDWLSISNLVIIRFCSKSRSDLTPLSLLFLDLTCAVSSPFVYSYHLFSSVHNRPGCSHLTHARRLRACPA